ncbi:MAG: hypothetical protein O2854_05430 [Chloroflexi bacterium]|nr:hypothetical protein [Chloroflexota bacterium]
MTEETQNDTATETKPAPKYKSGDRVVVDLTGLASMKSRGEVKESNGIIVQPLGSGLYDVMFHPHNPYPDVTVASYVPEKLLRFIDTSD